ncbi:MAG TPA: DUF3515 domain-containing protein [Nocardioidaceae bacterium]|jgi:hypothetical protein
MAVLSLLATGCGGTVDVDAPTPEGADAKACAALVDALPDHVDDQPRRRTDPEDRYVAAWGDPPIVLRCGVPRPGALTPTAVCQVANGVGWFIPESQMQGKPTDITMTTVGRAQYVEVRLPVDYWPPAAAMVDLAPAIKRTVREVRPCL